MATITRKTPSAPLPAAPAYGTKTIAELLPSAAAALGVPGFDNILGLPVANRICVVMVDGLGKALLKARGGHAPFLRKLMENAATLQSPFPSTTAASLASLGTGLAPGLHGVVGYDVVDPEKRRVVNQLGGWPKDLNAHTWQPNQTVFERVAAAGVHTATVSLNKFKDSALTQAALRGTQFTAAESPHARVRTTCEVLAANPRSLVYAYWNELDRAGHRFGKDSSQWGNALEDLDLMMRTLAARVPAGTLLLLTADHGMVDVEENWRIDYSQFPELVAGVELTAGEPRGVQLHFHAQTSAQKREGVAEAWRERFGSKAWVLSREEAITHGLFGEVATAVRERIGDLLILAAEDIAFLDGRRVNPAAFTMVGQHGSMTRAECEIPLLTLARPITKKKS
ncbi:alkaline phosphatase family protein [Paeniglutamicibacter sp. Y32M11]|uniref:alkaline phosphatase family protein n=1 Tax=Paeniglutamicibacter sp. Y32M11 TaxID=2853258 RepID=UPI001C52BA18|nr:nucleotide pyrophosphatase/phosphodiesterase family protein [Paeniglutamicibacter sp. Y32M11]QXQ11596.1 alkaline phosphatase family protein [Paeniglutamicibacter sp. Y32M11]